VSKAPNPKFLIVGQGELEHTLRQKIKRLHLEEHLILTGFRSDVLSLQKGFDVFVMSSVSEGLGTSALDRHGLRPTSRSDTRRWLTRGG